MRDEDRIRVRHMLDAIESARRFTERRQREDLDTDEMLLFAVIRAIEILGEAAGKVSEDVRLRSSSISMECDRSDAQSPHSRLFRYRYGGRVEYGEHGVAAD